MAALDWLTARPIAHRGLHNAAAGLIENTAGAMQAAIVAGYGVETDVQISADGEAMVHHDEALGRLTEGDSRLDHMSAAELQRVPFRNGGERMMTLGELCDLVAGRVTMLVEVKSAFDGDTRLGARTAAVLAAYRGPAAAMSFDPRQIAAVRQKAPQLVTGIVAAKYRSEPGRHSSWNSMPAALRFGMGSLLPALTARPRFVAYGIADLPAFAPGFARHVIRLPLLTWTVRTLADRDCAARYADQMIFEGFRP
ncbi:MAG TPA: glycerophosphodiester phosphodiesterase family protein [Xanthobacteraceae bacterium]|nr:glycerophosphodiester phosphodiesterase family protein [Xanthobacteraceae bacterium]